MIVWIENSEKTKMLAKMESPLTLSRESFKVFSPILVMYNLIFVVRLDDVI